MQKSYCEYRLRIEDLKKQGWREVSRVEETGHVCLERGEEHITERYKSMIAKNTKVLPKAPTKDLFTSLVEIVDSLNKTLYKK